MSDIRLSREETALEPDRLSRKRSAIPAMPWIRLSHETGPKSELSWIGSNSADFGLAVARLQGWFRDELEQDLGRLPAEMLLDFIAREVGPVFYNRGLCDAQAVLAARIEDVNEAIYGLEKKGGGR